MRSGYTGNGQVGELHGITTAEAGQGPDRLENLTISQLQNPAISQLQNPAMSQLQNPAISQLQGLDRERTG